jgi:hypothetical protein
MRNNKLWCVAFAAAALAYSPQGGAASLPPPVQASSELDVAKARINAAVDALDEISSSMGKIDRSAIRQGKTVAELANILDAQVAEAQATADSGARKLDAVQPLPADNAHAETVNMVLTDARTFSSRVQAVLADTRSLSRALKAGDNAQLQKFLAAMSASAITLIDGQAIILRARKTFYDADDSSHDQLEAMASVCDATIFILKAGLRLSPPAQTAAPIRAARDRVAAAVASGRAKLRDERAKAAKARDPDRKVLERDADYQARIFDSLTESVKILGLTADLLEQNDLAGARQQIDALRIQESTQQNLIVEQLNAD